MKRTCLMCGKLFNSSGPGNRRCGKCDCKPEAYTQIPTYCYLSTNDPKKSTRVEAKKQLDNKKFNQF